MEGKVSVSEAKNLFQNNFFGPEEISNSDFCIPLLIPEIQYTISELYSKRNDYILILGTDKIKSRNTLTLANLRNHFGCNISNDLMPSFYNQDWYVKEDFMNKSLDTRWYLIKKYIIEETRSIIPKFTMQEYNLPSAVLVAYVFFIYWLNRGEILWGNDFVWCSDIDHNGDQIYVGKYFDKEKINKNGFSIHRHLSIKNNYGIINII
jgi:hypothetical protein